MRIIVLVKMASVIRGNTAGVENIEEILSEKNIAYEVNYYDLAAIEEAYYLKKINKDVHITALTAGPEYTVKALQIASGLGADELVWINTSEFSVGSEMALAEIITGALSGKKFDLIFSGLKSTDTGSGIVGLGVAGLLGIPAVTRSIGFNLLTDKKSIQVQRHVGKGDREVVQSPIPALLTIERTYHKLRYPGIARYLAARKKIVEYKPDSSSDLFSSLSIVEMKKARPRPKKIFTPDDTLSGQDKMKLIMSGGMKSKKKKKQKSSLPGSEQLYNFLLKEGFIDKQDCK